MKLFSEKGYERISMLDIATSIGVSQGLYYRYFKSKGDIYNAAIEFYVNQGVGLFISRFGEKGDSLEKTIDTMLSLNEIEDKTNDYHNFFNTSKNSKFHQQMELELISKLIPVVAEGLEQTKLECQLMIESSETIATYILYGQFGIWSLEGIGRDEKIVTIREYTKNVGIKKAFMKVGLFFNKL